jgi:hypothetical protein
MREISKYVADDGTEFGSKESCQSYEATCADIAAIMAKLPAIPHLRGCGFQNGDGYIQHSPEAVEAARLALLRIANQIMPHKWFDQSIADLNAHSSWAGRLISEMSNKALRNAWYRFECMTPDFREFGQPYFASHPHEAKDVCLARAQS